MSMFPGAQAMPHPCPPPLSIHLHSRWARGRGWEMLSYGIPTAETLCRDSLQGNFTLPSDPQALQSNMHEMVGLLTPKLRVEMDLPSSLLSSVTPPCKRKQSKVRHAGTPSTAGAPRGTGSSRVSSIQVSKRIWGFQCLLAAHGGTLRLFCPRRAEKTPEETGQDSKSSPRATDSHPLPPPSISPAWKSLSIKFIILGAVVSS